MDLKPTVTVVLPTYNAAHLLDDAIGSVLQQTFTDFEFLIVDNRSTDNSDEVIKKYLGDPRIRFVKNDTNIGLVGNWNKCIELATGEYIKFICSDDKFHPQILEKQVAVLHAKPEVTLVGCYKEEFGGYSGIWKAPFEHQVPGNIAVLETMKDFNYLGEPTCVLFRKADALKVGPFREYRWITDWEMWVRLLTLGDCYIVPERLCFTRNHPGQLTKGIYREYLHLLEEYEMFKNLKNGVYSFDFTGYEEVLSNAVKYKATCYTQSVPKSIITIYKKGSQTRLKRALTIAFREKVFGRSMTVIAKKITQKLFPSLVSPAAIDGKDYSQTSSV